MRSAMGLLLTVVIVCAVNAAAGAATQPGQQTVISCRDVCVAKAAAPKPGQRPNGHLVRQCYNNLTGQYVGDQSIPFTPCPR